MKSQTKRTIAATFVLPAALAFGGAALVASCDNGNSPSTEQPPAPAPKSFSVSISGTAKVGQELTANINRDAGVDGIASYVWKRGATVIGGNTDKYTLVDADEGAQITVTVSITGITEAKTSAATSTVAPEYANLTLDGSSIKVENRSTHDSSNFTNLTYGSGNPIVTRITERMTPYSTITKVILGSTNKKVGTVLTINAQSIIDAIPGGSGSLNQAIIDALAAADGNDLSAAKSLDGVRLAGLQPKNPFDGLFRESKKVALQRGNRIASSRSGHLA